MKETPTLETPRLTLREFRIEDAENVYEWTSSFAVTRYLWWRPNRDLETTRKILANWIRKKRNYSWAVVQGEEAIGEIQVIKDLPGNGFEYGVTSKEKSWGHGFMKEASFEAIDYLFSEAGYEYGYAESDARNLNSHRLLKSLGFEEIDLKEMVRIEKKDEAIDVLCFRLTKDNFHAKRGKYIENK